MVVIPVATKICCVGVYLGRGILCAAAEGNFPTNIPRLLSKGFPTAAVRHAPLFPADPSRIRYMLQLHERQSHDRRSGYLSASLEGPLYDIRGWDVGGDNVELSLRANGARFTVSLSTESFTRSVSALKAFQNIYDILVSGEDDAREVWDYFEQIGDVFMPDFERLAPTVSHVGTLTLADLAVHRRFNYEFRVVDEKPIAGPVTPQVDEDPLDDDECDIRILQASFPVLSLDEVEVPYTDPRRIHDIIPQKVLVQGRPFFYKSCYSPRDPIDEIGKYAKITASGLSPQELRTSRLYAIVADDGGRTKGLLFDMIDAGGERTLTWMVDSNSPAAIREKWAGQIRDTVAKLHELGII